jgi:hypothetical protein
VLESRDLRSFAGQPGARKRVDARTGGSDLPHAETLAAAQRDGPTAKRRGRRCAPSTRPPTRRRPT